MKMDEFYAEEFRYEETETRKKEKKRADLISKKLGELLLQGYRMLNSTCEKCECILMQKKNDPLYCVSCQDKEVLELSQDEKIEKITDKEESIHMQEVERKYVTEKDRSDIKTTNSNFDENIEAIKYKINWATEQLKSSNVVSYNIELLEMIKKASEAILLLQKI